MNYSNDEFISIIKSISDNTRLKIISILSGQERNANQILEQLEITQPTLSHHMSLLTKSGLVKTRKDWNMVYYSIDKNTSKRLIDFLEFILLSDEQ